MPSSAELSRQYIEARNAHDLDGLVALVAGAVDFKRPDDPALTTSVEVRARYAEDWSTPATSAWTCCASLRVGRWSRRSRSMRDRPRTDDAAAQ
jgi:hypothetical protein